MLAHIKILSLWEIAHYWHNYDPRLSKTHQLPLEVRDTLLVLSMTYSKNLNIRVEQNKTFLIDLIGRTRRLTSRHYRQVFKKSMEKKIFGKRFFSSMFLTRSQLAKWCIDNKEPLPEFWFSDNDNHPFDVSDENLLKEMSVDGHYKVMLLYDDHKNVNSESASNQSSFTTVSDNAVKAAKAKHAQTNAIKSRFINFHLTEGDKYPSKKASAEHFFNSLEKREQFVFNSCATATRVFLDALRNHQKQKKS
ncbi:MAG: hypothetical protein DYH15_09415 [Nitrosomonas sp. PRO4]|nr:hypothetical protein [Nitrosomonas sp. PRO4]